ncbi:MAG: hypothetical protein WDN00_19325 [Limisphaerales bacterium]
MENQNPQAVDPFPFVVADATRLKQLGWQRQTDLQIGLTQLIGEHYKTPA